jgi:hypothetical protein
MQTQRLFKFAKSSVDAGIYLDPALFPALTSFKLPSIRTQTFDIGIAFDRVQQRNGFTADFRWRVPILRCYGWSSDVMVSVFG